MASGFESYLQTLTPSQPNKPTPLSFEAWSQQSAPKNQIVDHEYSGAGQYNGGSSGVGGNSYLKKQYEKYLGSLGQGPQGIPNQVKAGFADAREIGLGSTAATGQIVRQSYEDAFRQRAAGIVGSRRELGTRLSSEGSAAGLSSGSARRILQEGDADTVRSLGEASADSGFQSGLTLADLLRGGATEQIGLHQSELQALIDYEAARRGAAATRAAGNTQAIAGIATAAAIALSDRRLKVGIERVGTSPSGLPINEFAYVSAPDMRYRGVMSDEVRHIPGAVLLDPTTGFECVDYSLLDVTFERI